MIFNPFHVYLCSFSIYFLTDMLRRLYYKMLDLLFDVTESRIMTNHDFALSLSHGIVGL